MPENTTPTWFRGYVARLIELGRIDNPYRDERKEQWNDGWLFADAEVARWQSDARGGGYPSPQVGTGDDFGEISREQFK